MDPDAGERLSRTLGQQHGGADGSGRRRVHARRATAPAGSALTWFADESASAISGFNGYARTVRITDCGGGVGCGGIIDAGMRLVTVAVTFQPLTSTTTAAASKTIPVSLLITKR